MLKKTRTAVIALGGNAISREFEEGNITQQFSNTRRSLVGVADLIEKGYRVALTHGNGPQVGNSLIRVENARDTVPPTPLGVLVADLSGGMGYMIQQSLQNKLLKRGVKRDVVTMVTQVVVDKNDPSILKPSKFVGPFYRQEQVPELEHRRGWVVKADANRGFRRVVPSPRPLEIVEKEIIRKLVTAGTVVIAAGGGGIPVYRETNGVLEGIDGVIDKDRAAAILGKDIAAQELFILTAVDQVALNYGTPRQKNLAHLSIEKAREYLAAGEFPAGSMGPKIEAAISFLEHGGEQVVITSIHKMSEALNGHTGTRITRDKKQTIPLFLK